MKLISISGLDGSGKSTQIELLKEYFQARGKKVFYFHAVAFSIANRHKTQDTRHKTQDTRHKTQDTKSVTQASWTQIQLRRVALFIDLLRFKKLLKKLSNDRYDYLLSDRYFYDSLVNIAYLSKNSHLWKRGKCERVQHLRGDSKNLMGKDGLANPSSFLPFLKGGRLIPRPDFPFYLNADPEKIMARPRPADQGLEYLTNKKKILAEFSKENNLIKIDGNRSEQEVFEEILEVISA